MIEPKDFHLEKERLKSLESYSILDSLPEEDYDNLTAIAAEICGTPISLVSLVDNKRQWFKSHHGLDASETPKEYAFCAHAINDPKNVFIVQDARTDERFHDNPLVTGDPHVIFYAGVPLIGDQGMPLGTLCVIDNKPNLLSKSQLNSLKALSNQVMHLIELRKHKNMLADALINLEQKNQELERFALIVAHDLKSPLVGIARLSKIFGEQYASKIGADGHDILKLISSSSTQLKDMVDDLLSYSRSDNLVNAKKTKINIAHLKQQITELFSFDKDVKITLESDLQEICANDSVIHQILNNVVSNAVKYNDKKKAVVRINISEDETQHILSIKDNGPGIAFDKQEQIFDIFQVIISKDKYGLKGNGIGLATVKKIVDKNGGSIILESELGKGANFIIRLKK